MPRNPEATRRRILDAAYELFYRMGFGRVGVDEVAAFAAVTKRTLYYHFRSRTSCLRRCSSAITSSRWRAFASMPTVIAAAPARW